jgi:integrase/recombinase XerD
MWKAVIIKHQNESRIAVYFENSAELNARIIKLKGSRWSQSLGVWHLPDTEEYRIQFRIQPKDNNLLNFESQQQLQDFKSFLCSRRYSENTIKTYLDALKSFFTSAKII